MGKRSREFDAYIAGSAAFARPILEKLRHAFHKACPPIEETIKWSYPHFEHMGIVGSMAAFKQHVSFGFWKGQLMRDPKRIFAGVGQTSMVAVKVRSLSELPAEKDLIAYIKEAVRLNEAEVKVPRARVKRVREDLEIPAYFMAAVRKKKKALATFEGFSYSHKKEYVEWVTEAKQEATRRKRLSTTVEWLADGKPRNWKYAKGGD